MNCGCDCSGIPVISAFGLLAYLLGAIPNGFLIAKAKGIDIRKVGSGNIGATNVYRSVSKPLGLLTFALDALKGAIPAIWFPWQAAHCAQAPLPPWLPLLFGGLAIVGHTWPVYLKFKGGKGVATSAGALIGIAPAATGIGALCWLIALVTLRYMSAASIIAALAVPAAGWWLYYRTDGPALPLALSVLGALIIWRHQGNIQRLMNGSENRFEFKKKTS